MSHPTDVTRFFEDLDGGVLAERLGVILSHAAAAATDNPKKKAKVTLDLSIENIGSGSQVGVIHKLSFKVPTAHGATAEDHTTETVMYVNQGGEMSLEPKNQLDMIGHHHRKSSQQQHKESDQ
ncbi:hypothetical protein TW86_14080 [Halomonas sp. S2151]|uniref:hypothetical protein n=1 Tax=unclassified Halomonas TaxID=2609666 RepID=UPI0005FA76C2|nr:MULTISPECIES: hypothetical protein [unclassified Halomonas]KJZ10424.1 hypothetical protein TW86_14080 [Halomonas sp. S2151]MBR9770004.1 hypothetical protein [Gammaproteobacteria bacterium]MBY6109110.1 hypothetical protein [Halomonas sp. DP1Y21-3]